MKYHSLEEFINIYECRFTNKGNIFVFHSILSFFFFLLFVSSLHFSFFSFLFLFPLSFSFFNFMPTYSDAFDQYFCIIIFIEDHPIDE